MPTKDINDCFQHDKDRLTHFEAIEILKSNITPLKRAESVHLRKATGRVLTATITAPRPIPAHRNAAVDGYAYNDADYNPEQSTNLTVRARIKAGDPVLNQLETASAARIFTGAPMPTPLTSVAMQEDCKTEIKPDGTEIVTLPKGLKPNANCRAAGEDTQKGAPLIEAGTRLKPQHIAALAAAGIHEITTNAPIKIACLSTGDELIDKPDEFAVGKVFDSNRPMLKALTQQTTKNQANTAITDLGILKDDPKIIEQTLINAAQTHDVIITSAGASKGEEDHIINSLTKLGTRHLWQVAIKPGRPMSFGQIGDCLFIGLPGNPVAAFVCYLLYAHPLLCRLSGEPWPEPPRFSVPANFCVASKKPDRREFLRGQLVIKDGESWVEKYQKDGSGLITSLTRSNCLIELEESQTSLKQGELVNVLPFSTWGL